MNEMKACEIWPFPSSTTERYVLQCVSSTSHQAIRFDGQPITRETINRHLIFRITLAVTNTSRAAMAEFLVVIRPPLVDHSGFQYIERVSAVRNQVGAIDVNMPTLFFDKADDLLKVALSSFADEQRVAVEITKWYDNMPGSPRNLSDNIPANEVNFLPGE